MSPDTRETAQSVPDSEDRGVAETGGAEAAETDAGAGVAPWSPAVNEGVAQELAEGQSVAGELIAIYEHGAWWHDPEDVQTQAVFDPNALADLPEDDRCLRLVRSDEIGAASAWPLPDA